MEGLAPFFKPTYKASYAAAYGEVSAFPLNYRLNAVNNVRRDKSGSMSILLEDQRKKHRSVSTGAVFI